MQSTTQIMALHFAIARWAAVVLSMARNGMANDRQHTAKETSRTNITDRGVCGLLLWKEGSAAAAGGGRRPQAHTGDSIIEPKAEALTRGVASQQTPWVHRSSPPTCGGADATPATKRLARARGQGPDSQPAPCKDRQTIF